MPLRGNNALPPQEVLDGANASTFRELAAFAHAQHSSPSKRPRGSGSAGRSTRLIPTALTVAGGVNSIDHARTFPDLLALLRGQVGPPTTDMNTLTYMESWRKVIFCVPQHGAPPICMLLFALQNQQALVRRSGRGKCKGTP